MQQIKLIYQMIECVSKAALLRIMQKVVSLPSSIHTYTSELPLRLSFCCGCVECVCPCVFVLL